MNRNKSALLAGAFLFLVLFLVLFVLGGRSCRPKEDNTLKIGAVLPLTGRFAFMGEPIRSAMEVARQEVNSQGGVNGRQLQIVYYDSQGDPKAGVSAVQRLLDLDRVRILTTFLTGVSEAAKVVTEQQGALLVAQTVSPTITKDSRHLIRMHFSFIREGELLRDRILKVGAQPVGFIRSKDPSTSFEVEQVIIPGLRQGGLAQVVDETFDVGTKDFRPQVAKLKADGVKQVCILGYGSDFPNLLKELAVSGMLSAAALCGNLGFVEIPADTPTDLLANAVFTAPPFLLTEFESDQVRTFRKAYKAATSREVPSYSAYYAYDTVMLLKQAIELAGSDDPAAVRQSLGEHSFALMTGSYRFSAEGESHPPAVLATFKDHAMISLSDTTIERRTSAQ